MGGGSPVSRAATSCAWRRVPAKGKSTAREKTGAIRPTGGAHQNRSREGARPPCRSDRTSRLPATGRAANAAPQTRDAAPAAVPADAAPKTRAKTRAETTPRTRTGRPRSVATPWRSHRSVVAMGRPPIRRREPRRWPRCRSPRPPKRAQKRAQKRRHGRARGAHAVLQRRRRPSAPRRRRGGRRSAAANRGAGHAAGRRSPQNECKNDASNAHAVPTQCSTTLEVLSLLSGGAEDVDPPT